MENASKALIIAGAILLSILIIGLGMAVYNNASSTTGKSDLSSQEISAHNSTFEAYEGRIKGSQVKALINAVEKNNKEYDDRPIKIEANSDARSVENTKNTTTYHVYFEYNGNDNLISGVAIYVYGSEKDENPYGSEED